jgi:hypothetical protein
MDGVGFFSDIGVQSNRQTSRSLRDTRSFGRSDLYTRMVRAPCSRAANQYYARTRVCVFIRAMDSACEGSLRRRGPSPVADAEVDEVFDLLLVAFTDSCGRNPRDVY